jgi:hypothetical protein
MLRKSNFSVLTSGKYIILILSIKMPNANTYPPSSTQPGSVPVKKPELDSVFGKDPSPKGGSKSRRRRNRKNKKTRRLR